METINGNTDISEVMRNSDIPYGFFNKPIQGSSFENIFTYPEKFGTFGTNEFNNNVQKHLKAIKNQGLTPILTLEPLKNTREDILNKIISGEFDAQLLDLFKIIAETGAIFRPMHEMDTNQERYPWSGKSPSSYISAWQHLYNLSRQVPNGENIKFLWSPAGENSMMEYFPGDKYVDIVGFSLYDYPSEVDKSWYGKDLDIASELYRKIRLLPQNKPIIIPEFGIAAKTTGEYFTTLQKVLDVLKTYNVQSIIFFNSNETLKGYEDVSFKVPIN